MKSWAEESSSDIKGSVEWMGVLILRHNVVTLNTEIRKEFIF